MNRGLKNISYMRIKTAVALLILFLGGLSLSGSSLYNVVDYGAKGDSVSLETEAIQKAIDQAWSDGGGTVLIPPGVFRIGSLILKDNVNLHIQAGAILLGSADIRDYTEIIHTFESRTNGLYARYFMVFAEDAKNISITGKGTIYGNGLKNFQRSRPQYLRPFMVRLVNCSDVTIRDVNLLEPANWSCHLLGCDRVVVDGVRMENNTPGNGDGLDIDGSNNVRVSNSYFNTVDDAIVMKSTCDCLCSDVTITNCNITSKHGSALKTGTESNGGFRNISISNCTIRDTPRYAGIEFMTVDGGVMENITVTNIVMENVGSPLFLQLGNRARPFKSGQYVDHVSQVKDISFSHIYADSATMPLIVSGLRGKMISNISFNDIRVNYYGTIDEDPMAVNGVPLEETSYPMCTMYGKNLPAYGFYGRNFDNTVIRNLRIHTGSEDEFRPAMVLDNVTETEIYSMNATVRPSTPAMIYLRSSGELLLNRCRSLGTNSCLIISEDNGGNLIYSDNILKPGQEETKFIGALQDLYLFDDFDAEIKIDLPAGGDLKGNSGYALSLGHIRESFKVEKGKVYQVSVLTTNMGGSPEKLVIEYAGNSQEFTVDGNYRGWAPITLTEIFTEDQDLSVELFSDNPGSDLVISRIYVRSLNLGYTD